MIKSLIIEDDPVHQLLLQLLLQPHQHEVEICSYSTTVADAVQDITVHQPELVFLDIDLHGGSGFEVLDLLEERHFEVIFISTQDYAAKALNNYAAAAYLLKPFVQDDLNNALRRALAMIALRRHAAAYQTLFPDESLILRLTNPESGTQTVLQRCDTLCVAANGHQSRVYDIGKAVYDDKRRLRDWEILLGTPAFMRIHRSYIVSLPHVLSWELKGKQVVATLSNGMMIPVSRPNKKEFVKRWRQICSQP